MTQEQRRLIISVGKYPGRDVGVLKWILDSDTETGRRRRGETPQRRTDDGGSHGEVVRSR